MGLTSDAELLLEQLKAALAAAPSERRHFIVPVLSGQVVIIHKGLARGHLMPSGSALDELLQASLLAKVRPHDDRDQRYEVTPAGYRHVRPSSWRGRLRRVAGTLRSISRPALAVMIGTASTVIGGLVLLWLAAVLK